MWSSGAAGGRIPASSPSFLAGEAAGKDHMLTRTRLVAGVGAEDLPASGHDGARRWWLLELALRRRGGAVGTTRDTGRCFSC